MIDFRLTAAVLQAPLAVEPFYQWRFPDGTQWTTFYRVCNGYLLRFPDLADFLVSADGAVVTCSPVPKVSYATTQHLYLNQVFPLVLSKRGKLVFHASAVEVPEGAIAFVAESGFGKSTLAASFASAGNPFLTDDRLVLDPGSRGYQVMPSHPSIRLWKDSESAVDRSTKIARLPHFASKIRLQAGRGLSYCDQPRPLHMAYFLGQGDTHEIGIRRFSASEAMVAWVKNSFLLDVEDQNMLGRHFDGVANLANRLPCYHLDYPRRFEELDRLRQAVLKHAASEVVA